MRKKELLERIEKLEAQITGLKTRIDSLEYNHYIHYVTYPQQPLTITYDIGTAKKSDSVHTAQLEYACEGTDARKNLHTHAGAHHDRVVSNIHSKEFAHDISSRHDH